MELKHYHYLLAKERTLCNLLSLKYFLLLITKMKNQLSDEHTSNGILLNTANSNFNRLCCSPFASYANY